MKFSPDGKILVGCLDCRFVFLWDVPARKAIGKIAMNDFAEMPPTFSSIAFRPDGKSFVAWSCDRDGKHQAIKTYDLATRRKIGEVKVEIERCTHIAFSPDMKAFAASEYFPGEIVVLRDTAAGKKLATLKVHGPCGHLAFSPDGKSLAVEMDETVGVWDVATRKKTITLKETNARQIFTRVAFSPDGKTLAAGHMSRPRPGVTLWDVASGRIIATLRATGEESIRCVSFSPDGKVLAAGGDNGLGATLVYLWKVPQRSRGKEADSFNR